MRDPIYINQGRKDVIYQGRWYNKDGSIPPVLLAHATRGALLTMKNLTFEEIRKAPTSYLRKCLREDLDVEIADMISKELFEIREVDTL